MTLAFETRTTEDIEDTELKRDNYAYIRYVSKERPTGGIVIFLKSLFWNRITGVTL